MQKWITFLFLATKFFWMPFCVLSVNPSISSVRLQSRRVTSFLFQRKGIHRCGKCRLNFLTYKEKVEHRTHVHKTFRKPKALEGLPAGTKVWPWLVQHIWYICVNSGIIKQSCVICSLLRWQSEPPSQEKLLLSIALLIEQGQSL